ncbi:ATRX chromatin remodeler XNP isoform X2 [Lycorma delicatula]|uniref:ATRX chromatin remodeler XNP isoform X2 n=1 Tax=Lycorma delicatula TaxID=130591 RepID=UPI003F51591A
MGRPKRTKSSSEEHSSESDIESPQTKNNSRLVRVPGETLQIFVSEKEENYRKKKFPDPEKVKDFTLNCTVCAKNVGPAIFYGTSCYMHSALGVLVCKECQNFYGDGNFSIDSDGDEKYCRWCAQGGKLFICDKCNCSFCRKCVKTNLSRKVLQEMDDKDNWSCFICKPEALFDLRAQAWAAHEIYLMEKKKTNQKKSSRRHSDSSDEDLMSKSNKNKKRKVSPLKETKKKALDKLRSRKNNTCSDDGSSTSKNTSLSKSSKEKKFIKIGIKLLDVLMKNMIDFSKLVLSRTSAIHVRYINKSNIKSSEDLFSTIQKIEKFLKSLGKNINNFLDQLNLDLSTLEKMQSNDNITEDDLKNNCNEDKCNERKDEKNDENTDQCVNILDTDSIVAKVSKVTNDSVCDEEEEEKEEDKVNSLTTSTGRKKMMMKKANLPLPIAVNNESNSCDEVKAEKADSPLSAVAAAESDSCDEIKAKKDDSPLSKVAAAESDSCDEIKAKKDDSPLSAVAAAESDSCDEIKAKKDDSLLSAVAAAETDSCDEIKAKKDDSPFLEASGDKSDSYDKIKVKKDLLSATAGESDSCYKVKKKKATSPLSAATDGELDSCDKIKENKAISPLSVAADSDSDSSVKNKVEKSSTKVEKKPVEDSNIKAIKTDKEDDDMDEKAKRELLASSSSDEDKEVVNTKSSDHDSSSIASLIIDSDFETPELEKSKKLKKKVKKDSSKSHSAEKKKAEPEDTDEEIECLLKNLDSSKRKRPMSEDSDSDAMEIAEESKNDNMESNQKKKLKTEKNEIKKENILDLLKTIDSEENEDANDGEGNEVKDAINDMDALFELDFPELNKRKLSEDDLVKQVLLLTTSSSSSSDTDEKYPDLVKKLVKKNTENKKGKKENKESTDMDEESEKKKNVGNSDEDKKEKSDFETEAKNNKDSADEKKEKSGDNSGSDGDGDNSNSDDIFEIKSKSKWRRNKLLTAKLTDTDTTDDEKKEERWRKNQKKRDDKSSSSEAGVRKKIRRKRRPVTSDSDDIKISISEESSDSSVVEVGKSKKKRKKGSSSSSVISVSCGEEKTKKKRKRIKAPVESSTENEGGKENSEEDEDNMNQSQSKGRKNIRRVMKDEGLAEATRTAAKEEEERRQRIAERQKLYNKMYEIKATDEGKVEKLVLDFDPQTKKELVTVDEGLVAKMKPHQAKGVKFMWESSFESVERLKTSVGGGCILAHCMGLGKTFQVVSLIHTILTNENINNMKTVLIVCPLSTVLNWYAEFEKWLKDIGSGEDIEVYHLAKDKRVFQRSFRLKDWHEGGGVMIIGYEMFRILTNESAKNINKKQKAIFKTTLLDPGPDLVVCDEGHMLKNENTALSKAMNKMKTLRRIVLTGTPLQNNLIEYHCMVQFVKPNLLGSRKEFSNRFVNPITNGQFVDSTERDFKIMKRRAHVLHKMLEGLVQRCDYNVLTPYLPPKQEYVLSIRLSEIQIKLYRIYIDTQVSKNKIGRYTLFADWQALSRIWSHPLAMKYSYDKQTEKKLKEDTDSEGSLKDFVVEDSDDETSSSSTSNSGSNDSVSVVSDSKPKKKLTRATKKELGEELENEKDNPEEGIESDAAWWSNVLEPEHFEDIKSSPKLLLLFTILKECELIGDKVLVFSQSLYSLDLIEHFLRKIDEATQKGEVNPLLCNHTGSWARGLDYFRLDGSTSGENRTSWIKCFNREENIRARLFLISTRAGGLGINLTAANRVVIFDASWNPSYDVQSIFRIYRFGQKKPCYIYRFIAQGTMEEKVYERQVAKLSLSQRVVDEQQVTRYFSHSDLLELYSFTPAEKIDDSIPMLPKDRLMADMLQEFKEWIYKCHEHDSLLDHVEEEELNEEERKAAWEDFENEKKRGYALPNLNPNMNINPANQAQWNAQTAQWASTYYGQLSVSNLMSLREAILQRFPNVTPEQLGVLQQQFASRLVFNQQQLQQQQLQQQQQQQQKRFMAAASAASSGMVGSQLLRTLASAQNSVQEIAPPQAAAAVSATSNTNMGFNNVAHAPSNNSSSTQNSANIQSISEQ